MHAITSDGPLATFKGRGSDAWDGPEGVPVASCEFVNASRGSGKTLQQRKLGEGEFTAEYLFIGTTNTGDYHDSMNSENFGHWFNEQMIPTFKAQYPDHKMIVVLDNAPYHHNIPLGDISKLTKGGLVDLLMKHKRGLPGAYRVTAQLL